MSTLHPAPTLTPRAICEATHRIRKKVPEGVCSIAVCEAHVYSKSNMVLRLDLNPAAGPTQGRPQSVTANYVHKKVNDMTYTFYTSREHNQEISLSQIDAADTNSAVLIWRKTLNFPTAYDEIIEKDNYTPVDGMKNCWCTGCLDATDKLVMAHLVLTQI